jgi:hypothetical protein
MSLEDLVRRVKCFSTLSRWHIANRSAEPLRPGAALAVKHWSCACSECWARDELTFTCGKCGHKLLCTTN